MNSMAGQSKPYRARSKYIFLTLAATRTLPLRDWGIPNHNHNHNHNHNLDAQELGDAVLNPEKFAGRAKQMKV